MRRATSQWCRLGVPFLAVSCLLGAARANAREPDLPEGITAEEVVYLEESLGEGLGTGDGKLVDLALEGLRATGKGGRELAASLERAELAAALVYPNLDERVKIDAWKLAAKAKLGDGTAAEVLVGWARASRQAPAEDARVDRQSTMRARVGAMRCAEALPCLAYLKLEGMRELAVEILRQDVTAETADPNTRRMMYSYEAPRTKGAMQVLLDLGPQEGVDFVLSLIEDKGRSVDNRTRLLSACAELVKGDAEAGERLVIAFGSLVEATVEKGFDPDRPDYTMMTLLNSTTRWLPRDERILGDLEKLEAAVTGRMKSWVTSRVRTYRRMLGLPQQTNPDATGPVRARPSIPRPNMPRPNIPRPTPPKATGAGAGAGGAEPAF